MTQEDNGHDSSWLGIAAVHIWARAIHLPMRHTIGKNYNDGFGVLALILTFLWGALGEALPVLVWSGVYLGASVLLRIGTLRRAKSGNIIHSRYNGDPWLGKLTFNRLPDATVKMILEPMAAMALAVIVSPFGDAAFLFFFGGAICMVASTLLMEMREQRNLDDLNDAAIEAKYLTSRFHRRRM